MKAILYACLLLSLSLEASSSQMRAFRMQQRHLVLTEFKKLYKQRHLYRHRVRMLRHHRRVKTVDHSTVMTMRRHQTAVADEAVVSSMQTNIKTKANRDLEWMYEHHMQTDRKQMDEVLYLFKEGRNETSDGVDTPRVTMPQTEDPEGGESGYDTDFDKPSSGDIDAIHEGPKTDSVTVATPSQVASGDVPSERPGGSGLFETEATGQDDTANSQMGGGTDRPDIRPRFADPWRRR